MYFGCAKSGESGQRLLIISCESMYVKRQSGELEKKLFFRSCILTHLFLILWLKMDMTPKFYAKKGNNAVVRCVRSAAKRIDENKGIREDLGKAMRRESATKAMQSALTCQVAGAVDFGELEGSSMSISREDFRKIKMIAGMWEGTGGRDSDLDSTQSTPRSLNFPEEMTVELEEAIEDMRNETETRNDPLVAANRAYRSAMVVSLGEFLGSSELNVVDEEFTDNC